MQLVNVVKNCLDWEFETCGENMLLWSGLINIDIKEKKQLLKWFMPLIFNCIGYAFSKCYTA